MRHESVTGLLLDVMLPGIKIFNRRRKNPMAQRPKLWCELASLTFIAFSARSTAQGQDVYAPNTQTSLFAYVSDQSGNVVFGADIELSLNYIAGSNAHTHYSTSAGGVGKGSSVLPSSGTANVGWGYMPFTLSTQLVGEQEEVDVNSSRSPYTFEYDYSVGYSDLYLLGYPSIFYQTGYTTNHGNSNAYNHWTTASANVGLYNSVKAYLSSIGGQCVVCVNDAGLPFGGKFDIFANWTNPHAEHDRGSAVDLATQYNSASNECNVLAYVIQNPSLMVRSCYNNGAAFAQVETASPHVHCNFQNKNTYAH